MSIRKKILLILLVFALFPMIFVGILSFVNARKALVGARMEALKSVADFKAKMIEDFFAEQKKHILIAQQRPTIKKFAAVLSGFSSDFSSPAYEAIRKELDRTLRAYQPVYNYINVVLANPEGRIVYAFHKPSAPEKLGHTLSPPWGMSSDKFKNEIFLSNIYPNKFKAGQFSMMSTAPIRSLEGQLVGMIAFEIDAEPIFKLIQDTTGLGQTGETLIARKEGDSALFLNPLRHDPNAALKRKAGLGKEQALSIQNALEGQNGCGLSIDYRGEEVIAAWRYIPSLNWGMVAKIDAAEAFEPINTLRDFVIILLAASVLMGLFVAMQVSKSISHPIQSLHIGVEEIGSGNLYHKVGTKAQDEIGRLGRAFDQMAENLRAITASRDELEREIIKREKAEEMLKFTRFSIDHANDMLFWVDSAGNIIDVNDTACERIGYPRVELLSMKMDDIDPQIRITGYAKLWQDLKKRGTFKIQTDYHTRHGERIPVEITLNYIQYGNVEYNCAFARDTTRRRQVEEELQKSMNALGERVKELNCLFEISRLDQNRSLSLEEILQAIVDLIPSALRHPEITCAKILLNGQEFKNSNFADTEWTQVRDIIVREVPVGVLTAGYLQKNEDMDEAVFLLEENALLETIAERLGKIIERRQAQTELVESEKRFRDLVGNSLTGISLVQDNQVVYQNQEQARLLGPLPRSHVLADFDRIHSDDVEKVKRLSLAIEKGDMRTIETDFRLYSTSKKDSNADMIWVNCRASITDYKGKEAILVNMIDMTKSKELEHLLTVQDKMASLGRVAAGIAHEIRNPLSGINIYLNILKKNHRGDESEEKVNQILEKLQSASFKIESVIRRVMDFAKPSEPKLALTDINKPISEAIHLTEVTLRKSGTAIIENLAVDLPRSYIDPNLMEEMILNLLNNAMEAMKSMEKGKKIEVSSALENNRIVICISDSGPGVPPEIRGKIFDPYFTTKTDGTGIGLSLSHRIVTDHGGSFTVLDSKLGGAEFRIEIPVKRS